ncbi:MAG: hypothetical protein ACJARX_002105 [Psychroserpens sp.]|jgi:hypothetical protein
MAFSVSIASPPKATKSSPIYESIIALPAAIRKSSAI